MRRRTLSLVLVGLAVVACGAPRTRGARYVIPNAADGDLDARAKELCGPGVRYSVDTHRVSSAYTIGATQYFRGWTAAEVLCDNPKVSTDPDDASQPGYCIAGRGKSARVDNIRKASLVVGELVVDGAGALYRLPAEAGKPASPIETIRGVSQLSHDGKRYCALHGSREATCFVLETGQSPTEIMRIDAPVRAVVADMAIKEDGQVLRRGEALATNVIAAGAGGGRICVAKRGAVIECRADGSGWTPLQIPGATAPEQIWMTANIGFVVAGGRVLGSFPSSAAAKAPELATGGSDYTAAASGFRLGCLARSGEDAVCWDMLEGSAPAPARHLHGLKALRGAGNAVCGVTQANELVCVGEQRRTSRSVTNLETMLRGVYVARDVASFDLTETLLGVVLADGSLVVHVAGDC
jgi:hypothetical protein